MKQVVFDWNRALDFETNSAPFIQYSHARTCNILKKAAEKPKPDYSQLTHVKEKELVNMLSLFPEIFEGAVEELKPGDITSYANNLADKFNSQRCLTIHFCQLAPNKRSRHVAASLVPSFICQLARTFTFAEPFPTLLHFANLHRRSPLSLRPQ